MERSFDRVRAAYDTGPGYGHCSIASNGMWCASWPEREMCEWLIDQGIEFEMHKALANGRMCDFYFDGVYWEMDGMDRAPEYFAEKYGDLPHVVVTPEDFRFRVERHMATAHAENGDPIVSIEPVGYDMTYDVEMCAGRSAELPGERHRLAQLPRRVLRADLLPHGVAEGQLPGRVHGGADLARSCHEGQGPVLRRRRPRQMGIEILPPDVNLSDHEFVVVEGNIRFGLDAVKGVGYAAVEAIKAAREEGGPFTSLWDFCERVDARAVNKKAIEALIKCGAFGSTGATRKGMLEVLEQAQARRPEGPAGRADRPGLDLRPGFDGRRQRQRRRARSRRPSHPPIPTDEFEQPRAARDREGVDRPVHLRAPAQAGARGAARGQGRLLAGRAATERKDGDWVNGRRHHHRGARRSARATAST